MIPGPELTGSMLQLLDIMHESAALFAVDGTILIANETGARRMGLSRDDLIGRNIFELLPPDVASFRRRLLDEAAATGQPVHFTDERAGRWLEHRVVPIRGEDGPIARFAVFTADVTDRRRSELERAARTAELETIHAHAPVGILLLDRDRRIAKANQAAARMAGLTRDELTGRIGGGGLGCLNSLHDPRGCGWGPDCAQCELRLAVKYAIEDDMVINGLPVSLPVAAAGGVEIRHVLVSAAPVTLSGNKYALVSLQDITRLRRAEADVAFKAMVLDQIQDRVTVTDLEGKVVYVNDAACRSLKTRREDLVGRSVACYGDDARLGATQREIIDRTRAQGHWEGEVVNIAGDGGQAVLHCRTSLLRDERDVPVGMCGIATDITEDKHRESRLRESERRFRRLHEQLPIGYFGLDREGRYVDVNPAWVRLVGREREQLAGRAFAEQLPANHAERFAVARARVHAGRDEQVEIEVTGADGRLFTVFCVGGGSLGDGGTVEVSHWVAADVSERRRLESQLWQAQKLDALGRLAAGVSHDFNNQLTVISGYCDMLLAETPEEAPLRAAMLQIRRATERASSTTGHLLSFSRKRELSPREVDLNVLLRDLLHPVGKLIGESIRLRTELSPRLQAIHVDPGALQQAIFNLIINSRDAMHDGGSLVLRTANRPAPAGSADVDAVALTVADSGHGISPTDLERVFEPFFTTKPEGKGTGLGLSMVRGFIEQSGGSVELRSEPGAGTSVTLVLPAALAAAEVTSREQGAPAGHRLAGSVLVVEDSEQVRDLVVDVLRQRGATVAVASSPGEALAMAAAAAPFDLLVTDVVMPGLRGDELAARLLGQGRVQRVVFMSGYHEGRLAHPGATLLTKPFAVRDLVETVQRALAEPAGGLAADVPEGTR